MTGEGARASRFSRLRRREFSRLDTSGLAYLDFAGAGLYPASLVREHADRLVDSVLGNPHSDSGPSRASTDAIERARDSVLRHFDADPAEWEVCFTANATGACRLVGESFPFDSGSRFALLADNHNSVNGIREYARARGAAVDVLGLDEDLRPEPLSLKTVAGPSLFAFPAQSNFSGVQPSLELVGEARAAGYAVLLDAAAFVPTNELSLADEGPDFVCLSFYKMFGFPTGVGALIARREWLSRLDRPWFSGGTVEWVTIETDRSRRLPGPAAFEDGTPDFLGLPAVPMGLAFLQALGLDEIRAHASDLTLRLLETFAAAETGLGRPLVTIYGPRDMRRRGPTVAFNLLDETGGVLPYEEVERGASRAGIAIRGGCFCNPGASERAFAVDPDLALGCLERVPAGDFHPRRLGDCLGGGPVGALRASFGVASSPDDVDRLADFLVDYSAAAPSPHAAAAGLRGVR